MYEHLPSGAIRCADHKTEEGWQQIGQLIVKMCDQVGAPVICHRCEVEGMR